MHGIVQGQSKPQIRRRMMFKLSNLISLQKEFKLKYSFFWIRLVMGLSPRVWSSLGMDQGKKPLLLICKFYASHFSVCLTKVSFSNEWRCMGWKFKQVRSNSVSYQKSNKFWNLCAVDGTNNGVVLYWFNVTTQGSIKATCYRSTCKTLFPSREEANLSDDIAPTSNLDTNLVFFHIPHFRCNNQ